jgi:23S rRNA (guanosine2251-2'-O)-methyltransferase
MSYRPRQTHKPAPGRGPPGRDREDDDEHATIFGIHAVEAALRNPRRQFLRVMLTDNAEHRLGAILAERGITPERVIIRDLDRRLGPDTVHQGALCECLWLPEPTLAEFAARSPDEGPILLLDQVTDPHNVGAILRSAAVFGAAGVVMTRRHSPPLSGALAKAASGALEHVPVALVANLARAMAELAEFGVRRIGLDGAAETLIEDVPLIGSVALVLGAEGRGLRQLTRESCDDLVRIAMRDGPIDSLNVSNAAAVALHLAAVRRRVGAT